MNILISGYGRMGKEVEKTALSRGHHISGKLDVKEDWDKFSFETTKIDVVIDFSLPHVVVNNILRCFDLGIPIVTGTTGWYNHLNEIETICSEKNGALFYSPNFSLGVNIFFMMNEKLSKIMSSVSDYTAAIEETHHINKIDAPSGTAIETAKGLIDNHKRYDNWVSAPSEKENELPVVSFREDEVPGTHIVSYESGADKISLKHEAKNRSGFALGSVMAAEIISGKKGIYTMKALLNMI